MSLCFVILVIAVKALGNWKNDLHLQFMRGHINQLFTITDSLLCTDNDQFWKQKNSVRLTPPTQNVSERHTNTIRDYFKIEPH